MALKQEISSSCQSCNPAKCRYCILNLARQEMIQEEEGEKNISALQQNQRMLTRLKEVFAQIGAMIVSPKGELLFITQLGEKLLSEYFPSYTPQSLPESIQSWLKNQISLLTTQVDSSFPLPPCLPLQVEQTEKQLLIQPIDELIFGQYLFLLEEENLQSFSVNTLELLGITKREAEVLFWVAKDKCNAQIARVLGCSEGTVRKHLENLYKKLGVQTRTAAVMVAIEKLGLLKGQFVAINS